MKQKTAKRLCVALALATALTAAFGGASTALAEESDISTVSTKDTQYYLNLNCYGDTDGTDWRTKDTSSSTYIYAKSFSGYCCRLFVDGSKYSDGSNRDSGCMIGVARLCRQGQYEIHNNVYERGNSYAQITAWAYQSGRTHVDGVWSPDCGGDYTDLN